MHEVDRLAHSLGWRGPFWCGLVSNATYSSKKQGELGRQLALAIDLPAHDYARGGVFLAHAQLSEA
jgi:hypothetical protein